MEMNIENFSTSSRLTVSIDEEFSESLNISELLKSYCTEVIESEKYVSYFITIRK